MEQPTDAHFQTVFFWPGSPLGIDGCQPSGWGGGRARARGSGSGSRVWVMCRNKKISVPGTRYYCFKAFLWGIVFLKVSGLKPRSVSEKRENVKRGFWGLFFQTKNHSQTVFCDPPPQEPLLRYRADLGEWDDPPSSQCPRCPKSPAFFETRLILLFLFW